jgi:hypothetical protein
MVSVYGSSPCLWTMSTAQIRFPVEGKLYTEAHFFPIRVVFVSITVSFSLILLINNNASQFEYFYCHNRYKSNCAAVGKYVKNEKILQNASLRLFFLFKYNTCWGVIVVQTSVYQVSHQKHEAHLVITYCVSNPVYTGFKTCVHWVICIVAVMKGYSSFSCVYISRCIELWGVSLLLLFDVTIVVRTKGASQAFYLGMSKFIYCCSKSPIAPLQSKSLWNI